MRGNSLLKLGLACCALLASGDRSLAGPPSPATMHNAWITSGELVWRRVIAKPTAPALRARSLFTLALIYCESDRHRDRVPRLLDMATEMQVVDANHADYGNFRWQYQHREVLDPNAAEFCMRSATLLWVRHGKDLPPESRAQLRQIMQRAAVACERRLVEPAHTNIALMNASNLILLGEIFDNARLAEEGYRRFDVVAQLTAAFGFMEYNSPTYQGVTINLLQQLATCPNRAQARETAAAMLHLAWTQVAMAWLPDAKRLAGSHSRSYDFRHGQGELHATLWAAGWTPKAPISVRYSVYAIAGATPLPASAAEVLKSACVAANLPRTIQQQVGPAPSNTATTWIDRRVALGSAGSAYGVTDVPLAFDFNSSGLSRGYVTFDDRGDIFTENLTARGAQAKAEHATPFWTSVQSGPSAVGLVVYPREDFAARHLSTAFVIPSNVEAAWVNGHAYRLREPTLPHRVPLPNDSCLVLRQGTSAVGIRIPWSRDQHGAAGRLSLQRTDDALAAVALVIDHADDRRSCEAAAFVWVQVANDLDDEAFTKWHQALREATPRVNVRDDQFRIKIETADDPLVLQAHGRWDIRASIVRRPAPPKGMLAINTRDVGRRILSEDKTFRELLARRNLQPIAVGNQVVRWPVDQQVFQASPLRFDAQQQSLGAAASLGVSTEIAARASWRLRVETPGSYRLWANGWAPTTAENSFFFRLAPSPANQVSPDDRPSYWGVWSLPPTKDWDWNPVHLEVAERQGLYELEAGDYDLDIFVREPGAAVREWALTRELDWRPQSDSGK